MDKIFLTLLTIAGVYATPGFAEKNFSVVPVGPGGSRVGFDISYTFGTHQGKASEITGGLSFSDTDQLTRAEFRVPISSITTDNSTRDCHLREALGIDYKNSHFPEEHVCSSANLLPTIGPDSIAFPDIEFEFTNFAHNASDLPSPLVPGKIYSVPILGRWKIHGVTHDLALITPEQALNVKIERLADSLSSLLVKSEFDLTLADFGIVVKPFKIVGPLAITVGERVHVKIDLKFAAQEPL